MLNTPVLFLIFNRPQTTSLVFDAIKKVKPKQLFIAADGPRLDRPGEKEKCDNARRIALSIDWDCEIQTLFRKENLGCGIGVSQAITWFFSHVEKGIILEDDILPNMSFFKFAEEMLEKYKNNSEVYHITAQNLLLGNIHINESYYFSAYPLIWGWATWRRAWSEYDFLLTNVKFQDIKDMPKEFLSIFEEMKLQKIDTWDYQWNFTVWKAKGICIVPQYNLIENLGFGGDATHTDSIPNWYSNLNNGDLDKMIHPTRIGINYEADKFFINRIVKNSSSNSKLYKIIAVFLKIKNVIYGKSK